MTDKLIATDCDGVLFKWEEMFDKYMKVNGFEKKTKDHYELHMNYQIILKKLLRKNKRKLLMKLLRKNKKT